MAAASADWASRGADLRAAPQPLAGLDARALHALLAERVQTMRPWAADVFAPGQFSVPADAADVRARLLGNAARYQTNYAAVAGLALVVTLLMHFLMAVVLALLGAAAYAVSTLPEDYSVAVAGLVFTRRVFLYGIGLFAALLLLATDVGAAFFWVLGIAGIALGAHAVMHNAPGEELACEQP